MRPLITALFVIGLLSAPVEAADRYLVATRGVSTKVLRETESHEIRAFESINAFAANLTAAEVAELTRSDQVRFITPVVERHALQLRNPVVGSQSAEGGNGVAEHAHRRRR